MLSYSLDRHRDKQRAAVAAAAAAATAATAASEPAAATAAAMAAAMAAATAAAAERHSLAVYVAYVFYPPLYLAGPIVTYDDFEAQWASPSSSPSSSLSSSLSSSSEEPATTATAATATTAATAAATTAAAAAAAAPATIGATEPSPLAASIGRPSAEAAARTATASTASGLSPLSTAYVLRLLGAWLLLELLTRYFYGFALSRRGHAPQWRGTAPGHDSLRPHLHPRPHPRPRPHPHPRQVGRVSKAGAAAPLRLRLLAAQASVAQVCRHVASLPAVGGARRRARPGEPPRVRLAPVHAQRLLALLALFL
jgi:hypothetical protein